MFSYNMRENVGRNSSSVNFIVKLTTFRGGFKGSQGGDRAPCEKSGPNGPK